MHYLTGLLYINYYTHLCFTLRSRIFYLYVQPKNDRNINQKTTKLHAHTYTHMIFTMGLHQIGFTCIPGPAICTHNYARNFFLRTTAVGLVVFLLVLV